MAMFTERSPLEQISYMYFGTVAKANHTHEVATNDSVVLHHGSHRVEVLVESVGLDGAFRGQIESISDEHDEELHAIEVPGASLRTGNSVEFSEIHIHRCTKRGA
jgi:hypothetical protein